MPLPKQVADNLAAAEAIGEQIAQQKNGPPPEDPPPDAPLDIQEPTEDAAAAPEAQPPAEPPAPKAETEDLWEHKYRRLQGKYDAEVPLLHNQLKHLQAQYEELQGRFTAYDETKKQAAAEAARPAPLVTEKDTEAFGEDLIDLQRRVAREVAQEFSSKLDALQQENTKLKEQIQQTGNQVGAATFEAKLGRLVPDFDQVNASPGWVKWLNEVDPMIRGPRRNAVQAAWDKGDANALADYVKVWRDQTGQTAETNRQAELSRQVQPQRSGGAATTPLPSTGKVYSDAEAKRIFNQVSRLNMQGKYAEASQLDAEISKAFAEGRVRR